LLAVATGGAEALAVLEVKAETAGVEVVVAPARPNAIVGHGSLRAGLVEPAAPREKEGKGEQEEREVPAAKEVALALRITTKVVIHLT